MYTLVFAKVKGCIRDTETVLTMLQTDFSATVEHGLYRPVGSGTNQLVVNLQITELQREFSQCVYLGRVEHGYTV